MPKADKKATILIVDDIPANIDLIQELLQDQYRILATTQGQKALEIAQTEPVPDLILLDVMMPGMDGYTVCKKLKESDVTSSIPIIFITAMTEIEDEAKGFEVGAVDYITKPIRPVILKSRVKTHLSLHNQQLHLEQLVEQRTSELRQEINTRKTAEVELSLKVDELQVISTLQELELQSLSLGDAQKAILNQFKILFKPKQSKIISSQDQHLNEDLKRLPPFPSSQDTSSESVIVLEADISNPISIWYESTYQAHINEDLLQRFKYSAEQVLKSALLRHEIETGLLEI